MPGCSREGTPVENSIISLEVPPPDQRDPNSCEPYEAERDFQPGCTKYCSFAGSIGKFTFQDEPPRRVFQCAAAGVLCKLRIATHSLLNVSFGRGRCDGKCQCVTEDGYSSLRQLHGPRSVRTGNESSNRSCHRVHGGPNHFGSLKLHIPVNECRNQTACEDYENSYTSGCKHFCKVSGNLGRLQLEGKPPSIGKDDDEGHCELMFHDEDEISLKGVEQVQSAKCVKGVCRPFHWIEPKESASSASTTATVPTPSTLAYEDATFRLEISSDLVKITKRRGHDPNRMTEDSPRQPTSSSK